MRDAVIDEITVRGKAQPPAVVVNLIRGFLQRLPLPRLLHFVDVVFPQMVPVCSPAQAAGSKFPGSQLIRDLWVDRDHGNFGQEPEIRIMRLFQSHAVEWKPPCPVRRPGGKKLCSSYQYHFFFLTGCGGSLGYRQSTAERHISKSRTSDISR